MKNLKKAICIILFASLFFTLFCSPAYAKTYDPVVKIGIAFDSSALPAANLQNVSGMKRGFEFGYYDSSRRFVSTFSYEGSNQITVLKNTNMWLSGNTYSDTKLNTYDAVIGAYCLQVNSLFRNAEEALRICREFQDEGFDAYPCCVSGGFRVRIGMFSSEKEASQVESEIRTVGYDLVFRGPSTTCYTVVKTGTDEILYQLDLLGEYPLGIRPCSEQTWFKNYTYYGGFEYNRISGGNMNVVNLVTLTDYIKGVIPYEISTAWPYETQKAMALCVKSYAYNNFNKHKSKGFDMCNGNECQTYRGTSRATAVSDAAVEEIVGKFILYNGKVCNTVYHASSGGYTEDCKNVWGGDLPYLKAVKDVYLEDMRPYTNTVTLDDITRILQAKGYTTQSIADVYVSKFSDAGNAIEVTAVQSNGQKLTFSGEKARSCLNSPSNGVSVNSQRFTITKSNGGQSVYVNGTPTSIQGLFAINGKEKIGSIDSNTSFALTGQGIKSLNVTQGSGKSGTYIIAGTGAGHNIGFCQCGADSMGKLGFSAEEIIEFYFTGAVVDDYNPN